MFKKISHGYVSDVPGLVNFLIAKLLDGSADSHHCTRPFDRALCCSVLLIETRCKISLASTTERKVCNQTKK